MKNLASQIIDAYGIGGRVINVDDNISYISAIITDTTVSLSFSIELVKDFKETLKRVIETKTIGWKIIPSVLLAKVTGYDLDSIENVRYDYNNNLISSIIAVNIDKILDSITDTDAKNLLNGLYYGKYIATIKVKDIPYHIFSTGKI